MAHADDLVGRASDYRDPGLPGKGSFTEVVAKISGREPLSDTVSENIHQPFRRRSAFAG